MLRGAATDQTTLSLQFGHRTACGLRRVPQVREEFCMPPITTVKAGRARRMGARPSRHLYLIRSGVLDQFPGDRPALIRRHDVPLSDRCGGSGKAYHLPHAAFRAALPGVSRRPDRMTLHVERSFRRAQDRDALNNRRCLPTLTYACEPKGSLFVRAASQTLLTSSGETLARLAASVLATRSLAGKIGLAFFLRLLHTDHTKRVWSGQ